MQPLVALRAITRLVKNPNETREVFTIIRALSGSDLEKGLKRFQATELGKKVLQDRRQLTSVLNDRNMLATLPPSSFGRAYLEFITDEGLSSDGLVEASEGKKKEPFTDPDLMLFAARQRDMHDLWHVLTQYGRDELGEACLLGFTYAQNRNRGVGFIALVGCLKLHGKYGFNATRAIYSAFRDGRRAAWLPAQDWERLLEQPLDSVRRELGIQAPKVYRDALPANSLA
jgi:ubiquinone biosynthesis protein COQ4